MNIIFMRSVVMAIVLTPLVVTGFVVLFLAVRFFRLPAYWGRAGLAFAALLYLAIPVSNGINYYYALHEAPANKLARWTTPELAESVQDLDGVWFLDTMDPTYSFSFRASPAVVEQLQTLLSLEPRYAVDLSMLPEVTPGEWQTGWEAAQQYGARDQDYTHFVLIYDPTTERAILGITTI